MKAIEAATLRRPSYERACDGDQPNIVEQSCHSLSIGRRLFREHLKHYASDSNGCSKEYLDSFVQARNRMKKRSRVVPVYQALHDALTCIEVPDDHAYHSPSTESYPPSYILNDQHHADNTEIGIEVLRIDVFCALRCMETCGGHDIMGLGTLLAIARHGLLQDIHAECIIAAHISTASPESATKMSIHSQCSWVRLVMVLVSISGSRIAGKRTLTLDTDDLHDWRRTFGTPRTEKVIDCFCSKYLLNAADSSGYAQAEWTLYRKSLRKGVPSLPLLWMERVGASGSRDERRASILPCVPNEVHSPTSLTILYDNRRVPCDLEKGDLAARLQFQRALPVTFAGLNSTSGQVTAFIAFCVAPHCTKESQNASPAALANASVSIHWRKNSDPAIFHLVIPKTTSDVGTPETNITTTLKNINHQRDAKESLKCNAHHLFERVLSEGGCTHLNNTDNLWIVFDMTKGTSPERNTKTTPYLLGVDA